MMTTMIYFFLNLLKNSTIVISDKNLKPQLSCISAVEIISEQFSCISTEKMSKLSTISNCSLLVSELIFLVLYSAAEQTRWSNRERIHWIFMIDNSYIGDVCPAIHCICPCSDDRGLGFAFIKAKLPIKFNFQNFDILLCMA